MQDYMFLGYRSEEEFLEDIVGCDENYTLEDFFDSYDPEQNKMVNERKVIAHRLKIKHIERFKRKKLQKDLYKIELYGSESLNGSSKWSRKSDD